MTPRTQHQAETLTATEVSRLFRITSRQVRNLAASGELAAFRVGKLWRFRACDVEEYMRRRV